MLKNHRIETKQPTYLPPYRPRPWDHQWNICHHAPIPGILWWCSNRLWFTGILKKLAGKKNKISAASRHNRRVKYFLVEGSKILKQNLVHKKQSSFWVRIFGGIWWSWNFKELTTCFLIACSISMVTGNRCKSTTWKQTQYGTQLEELGKMICSFLLLTSSQMSSNIDHMLIYVFGEQFGAPTECHVAATVTFVRLRNLRILDCYLRLQKGVSC